MRPGSSLALLLGIAMATLAAPSRPAPSDVGQRDPAAFSPARDLGAVAVDLSTSRGRRRLGPADFGRRVFMEEDFRGNGRTCATCHEPASQFTITPARVESLFQEDPGHPLFRPVDSDTGDGASYDILRRLAVFKVNVPLHPRVRLASNSMARTLMVRRAAPTVANVALTGPFQHDGREATLAGQARGAVFDHMEPGRFPTGREMQLVDEFQQKLFVPLALEALVDLDEAPTGEFAEPLTPGGAAARGRSLFNVHCRFCHDGAVKDRPQLIPSLSRFQSVRISERNRVGLPVLDLIFTSEDGSETLVQTPDPGRAAITGDLADLNMFLIRPLRGIRHTAPYFHDHSAATLVDVVEHYNAIFGFDIDGPRRDDLVAYLESL